MDANSTCIACLLRKEEEKIRPFKKEDKKNAYMHDVLKVLYDYGQDRPAPWLTMKIQEIYNTYFEETIDYSAIKHKFNQIMLKQKDLLEKNIQGSNNPLLTCIQYACAGNYIDFGALDKVDEKTLHQVLKQAENYPFDSNELDAFQNDCLKAKELVYLTDNCGEIVFDSVFMNYLKELYPNMHITCVVRGQLTINDATMEDAKEVGLTELVDCIDNGLPLPGNYLPAIDEKARYTIQNADLIISKGQGNFESLYGEHLPTYFLFLCKCELFTRRFGLKQYSPVFKRESSLQIS